MLQWLRDNLKTFAWTLWLVIIAFILLYIPSFLQGPESRDTIATVGDDVVTMEQFRRRYQFAEQNYRRQLGEQATPELLRQLQLPLQVANSLIDEKILQAEARQMGIAVSDQELRKVIFEQQVFRNPDGSFIGDEQYRRLLQTNGFPTPADYEQGVRAEMLLDKVRTMLAQNVYIPDADVERRYREQVERAKVRYIQLARGRFAAQVEVTDAELAAYYEEHRNEYRQPERRAIDYLLVDSGAVRPTITVSDAEVKAYYDAHLDEFKAEEQVRASHILLQADGEEEMAAAEQRLLELKRRIEAGEEFATLAREYSEDTGSAGRGGDLNFFGKGEMVPPFEAAAFGAKVGELVGPVRTDFGVHLIKVVAHNVGGTTPLEQAAASIRFRLQSERAEAEVESRAREVADRIAKEGLTTQESWQTLAEGSDELILRTTQPFASNGAIPTLGQVPALSAAVFATEAGGTTDPVKVPRGWVIARVTEVLEPAVPELEEVRPQVRNVLQRERQQERAVAALSAAKERVAAGESFESVAAGLELEVRETGEFNRVTPVQELGTAGPAVSQAVFSMVEGELAGPFPDAQGAVLVQVAERTQWDPSEFEENKEATRSELENAEVQRLVGALLQQRRLDLGASFTRIFLDTFEVDPGQTEG
jgi:peptidyl-prolyl cis-trans isomerase D